MTPFFKTRSGGRYKSTRSGTQQMEAWLWRPSLFAVCSLSEHGFMKVTLTGSVVMSQCWDWTNTFEANVQWQGGKAQGKYSNIRKKNQLVPFRQNDLWVIQCIGSQNCLDPSMQNVKKWLMSILSLDWYSLTVNAFVIWDPAVLLYCYSKTSWQNNDCTASTSVATRNKLKESVNTVYLTADTLIGSYVQSHKFAYFGITSL